MLSLFVKNSPNTQTIALLLKTIYGTKNLTFPSIIKYLDFDIKGHYPGGTKEIRFLHVTGVDIPF